MGKSEVDGPPACRTSFAFCLMDSYMRFQGVSPKFAEMTGYPVRELIGMGVLEIVALESTETVLTSLEDVDNQGWSRYTAIFFRKDGTPVQADIGTFCGKENRYIACVQKVLAVGSEAIESLKQSRGICDSRASPSKSVRTVMV
jgi:PAS domain-containing protein